MLTLLLFAFADGVVKVINASFMHIITVCATLRFGTTSIIFTLGYSRSRQPLDAESEGRGAEGARTVVTDGHSKHIIPGPMPTIGEWPLDGTILSTENLITTFPQGYSRSAALHTTQGTQPKGDGGEELILDIRPGWQHSQSAGYELGPVGSTQSRSPLA